LPRRPARGAPGPADAPGHGQRPRRRRPRRPGHGVGQHRGGPLRERARRRGPRRRPTLVDGAKPPRADARGTVERRVRRRRPRPAGRARLGPVEGRDAGHAALRLRALRRRDAVTRLRSVRGWRRVLAAATAVQALLTILSAFTPGVPWRIHVLEALEPGSIRG